MFLAEYSRWTKLECHLTTSHQRLSSCPQGNKESIHCRTSGSKDEITLEACTNAAGSAIKPMLIFEGRSTVRSRIEWGWGAWYIIVWNVWKKAWLIRKCIFFLVTAFCDTHSSSLSSTSCCFLMVTPHTTSQTHSKQQQNKVSLCFCLSILLNYNVAQPLDVSPLKVYWSNVCHTSMCKSDDKIPVFNTLLRSIV